MKNYFRKLFVHIPSLTPTTRLTLLEVLRVHRVFHLSRLLLHWYLKPCNQSIRILLVVLHHLSEVLKCLLIIYCVLIVLVFYVVVFNLAIMAVQDRESDKSTFSYCRGRGTCWAITYSSSWNRLNCITFRPRRSSSVTMLKKEVRPNHLFLQHCNWQRPSRSKRFTFQSVSTATWLLNNCPAPYLCHSNEPLPN